MGFISFGLGFLITGGSVITHLDPFLNPFLLLIIMTATVIGSYLGYYIHYHRHFQRLRDIASQLSEEVD